MHKHYRIDEAKETDENIYTHHTEDEAFLGGLSKNTDHVQPTERLSQQDHRYSNMLKSEGKTDTAVFTGGNSMDQLY